MAKHERDYSDDERKALVARVTAPSVGGPTPKTQEAIDAEARKLRMQAEAPFLPTDDGLTAEEAFDAALQLKQMRELEEQLAALEKKEDEEQFVYFWACDKTRGPGRGPHHGVYFVGNPKSNTITSKDWYSTYKNKGMLWLQDVYCQECLKAGTENVLRGRRLQRDEVQPDRRWIYRAPKDMALYMLVGPHRANLLGHTAANTGLLLARKKIDEYKARKEKQAEEAKMQAAVAAGAKT